MSPTPIRDPNAPPDPTELRDIPDHQHAPTEWGGQPHNPVPVSADSEPPSTELPTPPIEEVPPPEPEPIDEDDDDEPKSKKAPTKKK